MTTATTSKRAPRNYPDLKFSTPAEEYRFKAWSRAQRERTGVEAIESCGCGCMCPAKYCATKRAERLAAEAASAPASH